MSTMKRLLSVFGIGAARIETVLDVDNLVPGETITGTLTVTGGDVPQDVRNIYLYTMGRCRFTDDGKTKYRHVTFDEHRIGGAFVIQPGEVITETFSFVLTYDTPLTIMGTTIYIQTGADIPLAFDPVDEDAIVVRPNKMVQAMFNAMKDMGFRMYKSDCESGYKYGRRYIQEFEFKPQSGKFKKKLDEVELICVASPDDLMVYMQVDRRARDFKGFIAGALDIDETRLSFRVTKADLPTLKTMLSEKIAAHADKHFF